MKETVVFEAEKHVDIPTQSALILYEEFGDLTKVKLPGIFAQKAAMRLGTVFRERLGMGKKFTEFFWSGTWNVESIKMNEVRSSSL